MFLSSFLVCILIIQAIIANILQYNVPGCQLVFRLAIIFPLEYLPEVLSGWRAHVQNDTFKSPKKFVEETDYWIKKQSKLNLFNSIKDSKSVEILWKTLNRQLAIFDLIEGRRKKSINKILRQKNKNIKDFIVLLAALLFVRKKTIKSYYLKRISLGLVN